jgi:acetolactate synthase-1/2/3 large subunit
MTGAKFMVEMMKAYGVTHAFYMPMVVTRALVEMEKVGIRRIMTHGEKAAAYMADGYARPPIGPASAWPRTSEPPTWLPGCRTRTWPAHRHRHDRPRTPMQQYRHHYQEIDHIQPFAAVTKYNVIVDSAAQLPLLLRQAFRSATSGAPGPVHLDLQGTTGNVIMDAEADLDVVVEVPFTHVPPFRSEPEMGMVRDALRILAGASRPVIVAGGGVASSQAHREVVELAERLSIPVATSLNAKGTIPDHHPLSVRTYSRWCASRWWLRDLVFFIGSHTAVR